MTSLQNINGGGGEGDMGGGGEKDRPLPASPSIVGAPVKYNYLMRNSIPKDRWV